MSLFATTVGGPHQRHASIARPTGWCWSSSAQQAHPKAHYRRSQGIHRAHPAVRAAFSVGRLDTAGTQHHATDRQCLQGVFGLSLDPERHQAAGRIGTRTGHVKEATPRIALGKARATCRVTSRVTRRYPASRVPTGGAPARRSRHPMAQARRYRLEGIERSPAGRPRVDRCCRERADPGPRCARQDDVPALRARRLGRAVRSRRSSGCAWCLPWGLRQLESSSGEKGSAAFR